MIQKHLLTSHLTITDFAKFKQVYPRSVYDAINAGKITPDLIGQSRIKMIDLKFYLKYRFDHNADKSALNAWFARKGKKQSENPNPQEYEH